MKNKVVPVFRIFDVDKAREFYLDWLGFSVDWEHRFEPGAPLYQQISRDDIILHLTEHHGDSTPGSKALIETAELQALCTELQARPYAYYNPSIERAPWNAMVMELVDPFGNKLLFHES